jgi:hypothetical protein
MRWAASIGALLAGFLLCAGVHAEPANGSLYCAAEDAQLDPHRQLRAWSLDLRGSLPTAEEHTLVDAVGGIPEGLLDEWLASPEFAQRVVRLHRGLLWNNVENVNLLNGKTNLHLNDGSPALWRTNPAVSYRGASVPCLNEPAEWDEYGAIMTTDMGGGVQREGWVWVSPFWAPSTVARVCAFDAQEALITASGTDCSTLEGYDDVACGCGPELRYCRRYPYSLEVRKAFAGDVDRRIAGLIEEGRSYLDLFLDDRAHVNGPMVHYLKHQAKLATNTRIDPAPIPHALLPDLDFMDKEFVEISLPAHHAGILSSIAFLIRFQTNRARANRFYNAFLCQPFQPPSMECEEDEEALEDEEECEAGLPVDDEVSALEADLQKRDGCKYCHGILEPAASYWGRWTEQGAGYLDPAEFPPLSSDCQACAETGINCSDACKRYYLVNPLSVSELPFLGWLKGYVFRHEEHYDHVEVGPRLLAMGSVVDHKLPRCVARTAVQWLLGREVDATEEAWVEELAYRFASGGYHYGDLVRMIVMSRTYRRVR